MNDNLVLTTGAMRGVCAQVCVTLWHGSMAGMWATAVYTNWHLQPNVRLPSHDFHLLQYGSRFKYLTFIDEVLQCVFFLVSVLADLTCWRDNLSHSNFLHWLLDALFTTLVFPLGVTVSVLFWGVYAVDPDLALPPSMQLWFPVLLNHVVHTFPILVDLVELCFVQHSLTTGIKSYLPILLFFVFYSSWLCYMAYDAGIWVYPFFGEVNLPLRCVLFAALLLFCVFTEFLCQKIHLRVWGSRKRQEEID